MKNGVKLNKEWKNFIIYMQKLLDSMLKRIMWNEINQNIISCKWVCSKEGYRQWVCLENENPKWELKAITRVCCEATFHIVFNKQLNKWIVKEFMANQNHPLVEQKNTQFLQSHMVMKNANKAQLSAMCDVDLRTSQIMDYMVQQLGGYSNVDFTKKIST